MQVAPLPFAEKQASFPEKTRGGQEDFISTETKYSYKPLKELLRKTLLDLPAKESGVKERLTHFKNYRQKNKPVVKIKKLL